MKTGDTDRASRPVRRALGVCTWSRFVHLIKVPSKDAKTVVRALTRHVRRLPNGVMASLTWDRGLEMAHHRRFSIATDVAVYFCDPPAFLLDFMRHLRPELKAS